MKLSDFFQTALIEGTPVMDTDYELKANYHAGLQIPLPKVAQVYAAYFYTTRYVTQNFELNKMEIADIADEFGVHLTNQSFQQTLKRIVVAVDVQPSQKVVALTFQEVPGAKK